ncbi:MAG: hypothetical protein ACE5Z5_10915 [Candidatus Bathyarchaeia archaeon]
MAQKIKDRDALRFLNALKRGTRRVYTAGLSHFLNFYMDSGEGRNISDFLDALEADARLPRRQRKRVGGKVTRDFVEWLKERELAPKSIRAYVAAVQSLASYYGLSISTRYVNVPGSQPVSQKFPWSLEKVAEFISLIPGWTEPTSSFGWATTCRNKRPRRARFSTHFLMFPWTGVVYNPSKNPSLSI